MRVSGWMCSGATLLLCPAVLAGDPQPPKGATGLSFRADALFPVGDDFVPASDEPIAAVRWWGSYADEAVPHDTTLTVPFVVGFYGSAGTIPGPVLVSHGVEAVETWTGGFCRGIEGLGGSASCVGPEPLYVYEACFDPPFLPEPGTAYWLVIFTDFFDDFEFWSWHEAGVPHPTGFDAVTFGFADFVPGLINACPGEFSQLVGPYDLAFELLTSCPAPCPWDLDASGDVGVGDFLSLLSNWGTDPGGPPDFDGDGVVGITDFLELLRHWGPCP
ncbi:MAG: DUF7901 domain-containing protein [Planctomycetota bacterium]